MTRRIPQVAEAQVSNSTTPARHNPQPVPISKGRRAYEQPTFVVTGANRGIGLGLARSLAKQGHVIATARDPSAASDLKAIDNVTVVALDLASDSSIAEFTDKLVELAPHGIDELWNNVGMNAAKFLVTDDMIPASTWATQLKVNCIGQTMLTNALLPLLRTGYSKKDSNEDKAARKIVFISSTAGSVTKTTGAGAGCAYNSSKAALNSSVKFWHNQLTQEGFVVVPIHPGWVKTDMGGGNADITIEESVEGMLKVVGDLTPKSELALRVYNGSILPW